MRLKRISSRDSRTPAETPTYINSIVQYCSPIDHKIPVNKELNDTELVKDLMIDFESDPKNVINNSYYKTNNIKAVMIPSSCQSKYEAKNEGINKFNKSIQKLSQTKSKGCRNYNMTSSISKESIEFKPNKNKQLRNVLSEKLFDIDKSSRNCTSKDNDLTLKTQMSSTISRLENSNNNKNRVKQRNMMPSCKESKTIESIKMLSPSKQIKETGCLNLESISQIKKVQNSPSKEISSLKRSPVKKDNLTSKRTNFTKIGKRFDLLEKNIEKCASAKQILNSTKNLNDKSVNKSKNNLIFGHNLQISSHNLLVNGNTLKDSSVNNRLSDMKSKIESCNKRPEMRVLEQKEFETSQSIADMTCNSDLCEIKKTEDQMKLNSIDSYTMIPKLQPDMNKENKCVEVSSKYLKR